MIRRFKAEQLEKAFIPILVTLWGMVMFVKAEQYEKTLL